LGTGGVFLRKVRARVFEKPTGFVWIEKGRLAGSGYPASRGQLEWLSGHGINVILTLTENPLPDDWLEGLPLKTEHIPMKDHGAPDVASLEKAVSFLQGQLKEGRVVLVHCLAGEGRTGCVLAAYLVMEKKVGAEEAIRTLRRIKPLFVEWSQEKAVLEYVATVKP
jgi:atypical dual specificity phosphatase